jgi:flagellar hook-associated protein 2
VAKAGPGGSADLFRNVNSSIMIDFVTNHSSISMLDEDANDLNKRIDRMNDYLIRTEDRYWKQFTAMEKAIQQLNNQSMWLMQQFGGGQ